MRAIHDYHRLEREYLNGKMSIRELAKMHDIKSYSTLAAYARGHNWYDKRARIQSRVEEKVVERVSDAVAEAETDELMQFRSEVMAVARLAIYKYAQQMEDPTFRVSTAELVKVAQVGLLIMGEPTSRTEERRLELSGTLGELSPEFLRRLVEVSRPRPALADGARDALSVGPPGTRTN